MSEKKIIKPVPLWKILAGLIGAFTVLFAATLLFARLVTPDTRPRPLRWSKEEIAAAERVRHIPDKPEAHHRVALDIPEAEYARARKWAEKNPEASLEAVERAVAAGELPRWYPRGQSPLMDRVDYPPVAERVGPEPVVMRGSEGPGQYGGVWVQCIAGATSEADAAATRMSYSRLFRFSPDGTPIVPHIAKGYEIKEGGRIWEIELRKIRWSNGDPVTADDMLFFWNDEMLDPAVGGGSAYKQFTIGGVAPKLEKLSEHKVRFTFAEPRGDFLEILTYHNAISPSAFLRRYHPRYGDQAFLEAEMKRYNAPHPRALYNFVKVNNPELPVLSPWTYRQYTTMSPIIFVRNPYYFAVDEQGRQLPYIDRVQYELLDAMMLPLAVANGRSDMQFRYLRFENYTEFAARAKANGFHLRGWVPGTRSEWLLYPNLNRAVSDADAGSAFKAKLLYHADFRKALSLAIDRETAIRAVYSGMAKPWQVDPGPASEYSSEKLRHAYTRHDPARANAMLDELWRQMGLDPAVRRDGYRCDEKGEPVTFYLSYADFTGLGPAQFVIDDWQKVGIRMIYQLCSRSLLMLKMNSRSFDFFVWTSESEMVPMLSPRCFVATSTESIYAMGWGSWFMRNGFYNDPRSKNPGCIPVPSDHPMYRSLELYEQAVRSGSESEKVALMSQITDIAADNLWTINIGCAPPKLIVVSDNLRNVPEKATDGYFFYSPGHTGIETYYFDRPNRAADADTVNQLSKTDRLPPALGEPLNLTGKLIRWTLWALAALAVALVSLRHPFVLRRLMIMVPTLLVISICVFTIVQLPPGDFLSNRILQLRESGATPEQIDTNINDLRDLFHFDDPGWKRYCRWMGFYYFTTFDKRDAGLLQGNMGYSMENNKSVNALVGDRITLTVVLSLFTVLFTWCLALPIGIYSACRQYSPGDYLISIIGFLGMCVPSFLLALILMALTGITGLFSAEYAVQPYWDWGKFEDMMRHIWVPVVVVGIAGTAGMIRIMRANLLDELGKPYVVTARAKGMTPVRLLFKYPVRVALNPFISGIGSLFPALVSGSSIVAIVMSLPMVGPLMLAALFSQDMNMAGSMLMVLSMLGVLGTLVSDLLLMLVDPRIRIGGGRTK